MKLYIKIIILILLTFSCKKVFLQNKIKIKKDKEDFNFYHKYEKEIESLSIPFNKVVLSNYNTFYKNYYNYLLSDQPFRLPLKFLDSKYDKYFDILFSNNYINKLFYLTPKPHIKIDSVLLIFLQKFLLNQRIYFEKVRFEIEYNSSLHKNIIKNYKDDIYKYHIINYIGKIMLAKELSGYLFENKLKKVDNNDIVKSSDIYMVIEKGGFIKSIVLVYSNSYHGMFGENINFTLFNSKDSTYEINNFSESHDVIGPNESLSESKNKLFKYKFDNNGYVRILKYY